MAASASRSDVLFTFSYETYADAVSRGMMRPPDRILSTLMNSDRVDGLLVANPFRFAPAALAREAATRVLALRPGSGAGNAGPTAFPSSARRGLHTPLRLRRADPVDINGMDDSYRAYDRSLEKAAARLGLDAPVTITTNPLVAGFAPLRWTDRTMFFARDDWSSSPARQQYWPAYTEAYRRIAASGAVVTAVSQQILDRIEPTGPHAVVPNGVEPAEWTGSQPEEPVWLRDIPHPRALYVGTLDSRLDIEGVTDFASRRPDIHTILMGPQPDPASLTTLRALPNVHVRPKVGRAELVATLRNVDLALLAHRRTALTEAMSPLKIYEYLAAGCPVLSIDLPPVRGIDDRVLIVDTVSDFADVAERALALGAATEEERLGFVDRNSWASRHGAILDLALGTG